MSPLYSLREGLILLNSGHLGKNPLDAKIRSALWQYLPHYDQQKTIYFDHLVKKIQSCDESSAQIENAEREILLFCLHLKFLMQKVIRSDLSDAAIRFLCYGDQKKLDQLKMLFSALRICQKLKDLEISAKAQTPIQILHKLAVDKTLKAKEKECMKAWIAAIQKSAKTKVASCQGPIDNPHAKARFQHHILDDLVQFFNEAKENPKADIALLEDLLRELGCDVLDQFDEKHQAWRLSLRTGQSVVIGEVRYCLGEILENRERNALHPLVFAVEGEPDLEMVAHTSEASAFSQDFEERNMHCGVIRAKIVATLRYGKVCLRERLYHPLNSITWKSYGKKTALKEDINRAKPIVELIQGVLSMPFVPYPLIPQAFAFYKNEMRATITLIPTNKRFAFEACEKFAYLCSYGTSMKSVAPIFTHLMRASHLSEARESSHYQELVKLALEGKDRMFATTRNQSINDEYLIGVRDRLYTTIQGIQKTCLADLTQRYAIKNSNHLKKTIHSVIIEFHRTLCPGSILIDHFFSRVRWEILYRTSPDLKPEYFDQAKKEIAQMIRTEKNAKQWNNNRYRCFGIFSPNQRKIIRDAKK
jgi:hypothetical protein